MNEFIYNEENTFILEDKNMFQNIKEIIEKQII